MGLFDGLLGNATQMKLDDVRAKLDGLLLPDERIELGYRIVRDFFVFTDRRMIIVDIQGMTGSKVDYLTIPYRAISFFSLETAGTFDLDAELRIWLSGQPTPIQRTLRKGTDTRAIMQALAAGTLR